VFDGLVGVASLDACTDPNLRRAPPDLFLSNFRFFFFLALTCFISFKVGAVRAAASGERFFSFSSVSCLLDVKGTL